MIRPFFLCCANAYGNPLTETTFTNGEFGTLYRAFGFNATGNDMTSETDARGNVTAYAVDGVTSRNEEVTDRCGNKTAYEYDTAGRTTKVASKDANGTELAHVSYAYDAFDNMTEIARGDGMRYDLAYTPFHNLESIGVEGKTEKLVQYTYKNGNGRLKEITYANGDKMTATYNGQGQMVAEKWYDVSNTLTAHYKYVYDHAGNIVRSIDILSSKEYTYTYEEGRIVRAIESTVQLNGEIVTSKTATNTVRYVYDSEGTLTKKIVTPANGAAMTTYYETADDNTVVKFKAGGKTVTSHSKTDAFGRKVFDELQLGTGFVSRQFIYHAGDVTDEHTANGLLKSSATSQLVSQIVLSDGRTLSYEYDAEERITKVIDSVDGTTEYTYDALGQLIEEKYTAVGDTSPVTLTMITYDNYGNITSKNGAQYTYDSVWKDLLISFGGQPITYDAQGNPTTYLGQTLTWDKGRQLKSYGDVTYTYNANGIRTSKTVNGVKHTYTLDGVKILRETWGDNVLIPLYDNEDSVCGIVYNDTPYYFLKNLQGDVIAIVNANGETVAEYWYDVWGACGCRLDTEDIAFINPFRYRGYYYDEDMCLYYLQSRYYDPYLGRFVNADDVNFLGVGGRILCYNLAAYCENNCINYVDYYGHTPSLSTLTKMHNAVIQSAMAFLFAFGIITASEVRTCYSNGREIGRYAGRMDIYSFVSNQVWEVKRDNYNGERLGKIQLALYTSQYVYSLYHSPITWMRTRKKPEYGTIPVYGAVIESGYLVMYHSLTDLTALIVYDYLSLRHAAQALYNVAVATSAAFNSALKKATQQVKRKVAVVFSRIRTLADKVVQEKETIIKAIENFLIIAGIALLAIVALIIFMYTGVPVSA